MANRVLRHVATTTGNSPAMEVRNNIRLFTVQMIGTTTSGTISATAQLQATNDPEGVSGWTNLLSTPLTLSSAESGSSDIAAPAEFAYLWLRAVVLTISGTGAAVQIIVAGA